MKKASSIRETIPSPLIIIGLLHISSRCSPSPLFIQIKEISKIYFYKFQYNHNIFFFMNHFMYVLDFKWKYFVQVLIPKSIDIFFSC